MVPLYIWGVVWKVSHGIFSLRKKNTAPKLYVEIKHGTIKVSWIKQGAVIHENWLNENVCSSVKMQPSRCVLRKTWSENMQQIYRRTAMPKCDLITLRQGYSPKKLLHIFRTPFPRNTCRGMLLSVAQSWLQDSQK